MPNRALLAALLVLAAALPLSAQLVETIEVRVTNVDVVVTDAKGNPVPGLTKDDFELRENGQVQPITNFYEIGGAQLAAATSGTAGAPAPAEQASLPPAEVRQRRIVVFIDQYSIHPFRRNEVTKAIREALDNLMHPGDDLMIVVWNRQLEVLQQLTSDRTKIVQALDGLAQRSADGSFLDTERERIVRNARDLWSFSKQNPRLLPMRDAYRQASDAASAHADQVYSMQRTLISNVKRAMATLSGLDGRKVMLYVGGNLEQNAGMDVFVAVDAVFVAEGVVQGHAFTRERRDLGPELTDLGKAANSNGVTMYMIDTGDRTRSVDASRASFGDSEAEFIGLSETPLAMGALATLTGGTLLSGTRNFKYTLDTITRDLGSYYSLGYRSSATGNTPRNIAVRVKKPGVRVRARRSFTPKTSDEEMRERVLASAFHPAMKGEMSVSVEAGKTEAAADGFRVPLKITFPSDITLLPEGDSLVGEFAVYIVVTNDRGDASSIAHDVQKVKIPKAVAASVTKQPFIYTASVMVRKGEQSVAVGIRDQVGGRAGFAKTTISAN